MNFEDTEAVMIQIREDIVRSACPNGSFVGASLSCADILTVLFYKIIRKKSNKLEEKFYLSKGHDVPALYAVLTSLQLMDDGWLEHYCEGTQPVYWHPNPHITHVHAYSGSLGHNLSIAVGNAYHEKLKQSGNRTFVLLGDGELNEGSNWEALQVAVHQQLNDLYVLIDNNKFQANGLLESISGMQNLKEKFEAFGCSTETVDGHSHKEIFNVFDKMINTNNCPKVIIFDTVRGKGIPSIEGRADRWFIQLEPEQRDNLINELKTGDQAVDDIRGIVVR